MRLFLDASALTKSYIPERGSDLVLARCAAADEVLFSIVALTEVVSALNRARRERRLADEEYDALKRRLAEETEHATVVELTIEVTQKAFSCLERSPLRALDALHVASALECSPDRFLSADRRQCEAARAAGLTVEELTP